MGIRSPYFANGILRKPFCIFLLKCLTISVNGNMQFATQRIHATHPYPMQSSGYFVRIFIKFTSRMQYRHYHFQCTPVFLGMQSCWDTTPVIRNGDRIVFIDGNHNVVTMASKRFINGVIYHFINEVMQSFYTDIPNVHGRSFSNCF